MTSDSQLILSGDFVLFLLEPIHVFLVDFLLGLCIELSDFFLKLLDLFKKSLQFIILLSHLFLEGLSTSCLIVKLICSQSFNSCKFIIVLSLPLILIIDELISISLLTIVLVDFEVLVSLLVSIFLELSFVAGLCQFSFDCIKSVLSLLIAQMAKLVPFFFLTERKLFLAICFVIVENLHHSEHIWGRSWVTGGNKLFKTLDVIPIWMSAEHSKVNDQESGCFTASSCAIQKHFMTLLVN